MRPIGLSLFPVSRTSTYGDGVSGRRNQGSNILLTSVLKKIIVLC